MEILREVVSKAENPVTLYLVGKDSAVMLNLAKKAFYPSPPPFPLMHVYTTWKFQEIYKLRDKAALNPRNSHRCNHNVNLRCFRPNRQTVAGGIDVRYQPLG